MSSFSRLRGRRGLFAVLAAAAVAVPAGSAAVAAPSNPTAAVAAVDQTSALERKRVDSVPTPNLRWYPCLVGGTELCTTVRLPIDYDNPTGGKVELALLKVSAANPARKIGTLFVNPGGPGGSAVELAAAATAFIGQSVLDRFDVVGLDPRGVGFSQQARCFRDRTRQSQVLGLADFAFPVTAAEIDRARRSSTLFAQACADNGTPVINSMSTAQYARDLDVVRRAVGDKKFTFLGFSYGSVVGQTYANMFPDRVRAVVIDGVADATRWYGSTEALAQQPPTGRILSGEGANVSIVELLRRCDAAGAPTCEFGGGDALAAWRTLLTDLKATPLDLGNGVILTYADVINSILGAMYGTAQLEQIPGYLQQLRDALDAQGGLGAAAAAKLAATRASLSLAKAKPSTRAGVPYDASAEGYYGVWCTDANSPGSTRAWSDAVAQTQKQAPDFGLAWLWSSPQCARDNWTALDEDTYRGPLNRTTATPLLVVGNSYDPATNVRNASAVAARMKAGLVLSRSWGHTAYGTSACTTTTVDDYLVSQKVPTATVRCVGDFQPFAVGAAAKKPVKVPGLGSPAPVDPLLPAGLLAGS